jgi:hypothetical protein
MPWGGSRHKSKPHVDTHLLFKEFDRHVHLLKDLGNYETASRCTSPDPAGIVKILPLVAGLITLEPSCEIHGQSLRNALTMLLTHKADVNSSQYTGKVWANLRSERITTVLNHMRTLKRDEQQMRSAVMVLTTQQFNELKSVVNKIKLVEEPAPGSGVANPPLPLADAQKTEESQEETEHPFTRKLKAQPSACSVDSDGFPNMLSSPQKAKQDDASNAPKSFLRKRLCTSSNAVPCSTWSNEEGNFDLKGSLGYDVCKRPATKESKVDALPKADDSLAKDRTPWLKLGKTIGKKPARAYICGSHAEKDKVKLIVEVSEKRSSKYLQIIDHILDALKSQHLTKNECLEMRTKLCLQFP